MSNYTYLTQGGYERLKAELDELKTNGRSEAAKAIAEARDKGDLSENAEYDAAKNAQGMLELKINELERALSNARIIDESQLDASKVTVLSRVRLLNLKSNKEVEYTLVSETEADLKLGKISVSSPIGKSLLGKAPGDVAEVETPTGLLNFKILSISLN
jgi:transcription elongation factor GreA